MDVSGVSAANQAAYSSESGKTDNAVNKEFFLEMLVTQMKYQDPLSPMDNNDFIAQTAQFTLVEEIQTMKNEFAQNKAIDLIGKYVEGRVKNPLNGQMEITGGIVDSVSISDGKATLNVGDLKLKPENIVGVTNGQ
ncbi:MAG: flagellar hook capping FlgD N-terminal domain-containing protein [Bacillota bacterium]|nr:flagellar hook capping FlgD N-terminal domain-containing protein [Bacillota bacterium]